MSKIKLVTSDNLEKSLSVMKERLQEYSNNNMVSVTSSDPNIVVDTSIPTNIKISLHPDFYNRLEDLELRVLALSK